MCGIAGFIDFNKKSSYETLQKMTDTLYHRGPDGAGYELFNTSDAQIGFGHRRLAIIDLTEHGKQPMLFDKLWITFNGEIYNFNDIKSELSALGHSFYSNSDTEVILHAYKQWGSNCLSKFVGMYAFVLFDSENNELFIARDRTGVKPLNYYFNDGLFLFASELKAFHEHPDFVKKIKKNAVATFMQYGNIPGSDCIFEYCTKLLPGHFATINLSNRNIAISQYWNVYDYYNQPKKSISFNEAKEETEKLLVSACNFRMIADVPVGIFLSSGYDSTTVTALLQKDSSQKLKTYTIGVPDIGLNEAPYAAEIAQHLGTDHTTYTCTEKEALEFISELPFYYDEPYADSSAIPTHLVSKIARKDVTVALSADGGDEVFAGYNRYDYLARYGQKINAIPSFARKIIAKTMDIIPSEALPILKNKYNFHNRYEKLKGILQNPSSTQIMLSLSQQFTDNQVKNLMNFQTDLPTNLFMSNELKEEFYSPLSYMMAIDYQTYLVDDIMQKVDRATMSVSLEGREPLLDHRLIEWAATLPDEYKYNKGIKKYILREITHQYIPETLLNRPKMGFAIPIAKWLATDLRPYLEEYINEKRITEQGLFNWTAVLKLKTDFLSGKKEYDFKMWYLLMFQMWYDKWMK
ncbi:MAG: asparagine synthase (glutamine-hydrolyzing) [Crocinitomicaceae bacterium]|nr:asparagine synthase (glutamine-hydrolyzing) [Crocinitomicaceae bacterium]